MASTTRSVILRFLSQGDQSVSTTLNKIQGQKDKLASTDVNLVIKADDKDALAKLDETLKKAQETGARKVNIKIGADAKDADATLAAVRAKADELGLKKVNIKVSTDGTGKSVIALSALATEVAALNKEGNNTPGILKSIGSSAANAANGLTQMIPGISALVPESGAGGLFALPVIAVGVGALVTELSGLISGLAVAGAGAGAFGLLALPAIKNISTAMTQVNADQQAYDRALTKTAKNTALQHLKNDYAGLDPAERGAITGINNLRTTYDKMAAAFQPDVFKVFNAGLGVVNKLLPTVTPFAATFSDAITGLLNRLSGFTGSKGFSDWLGQFHALEGPSITALGDGLGKLTISLGKLLTVMSAKDVVNTINIAFSILSGTITGLIGIVKVSMATWDGFTASLAWIQKTSVSVWNTVYESVAGALGKAKSWITGTWSSVTNDITAPVGKSVSFFQRIYADIVAPFEKLKGWITGNFDTWWATNGKAVEQVWSNIWAVITTTVKDAFVVVAAVVGVALRILEVTFDNTVGVLKVVWNAAWGVMAIGVKAALALVLVVWNAAVSWFSVSIKTAFAIVGSVIKIALDIIVAVFKIAWDVIVGVFTIAISLLTGHWSNAWHAMENLFKQVVNAVWAEIQQTFNNIWDIVSKVMSDIGRTAVIAWNAVGNALKVVWNNVLKPTLSLLINTFLNIVGAIIDGAARAFGWIPGIGGKLREAAKAFDTFRNNVNNSLNGINNKSVSVSVSFAPTPSGQQDASKYTHLAAGGSVRGAGGPTADKIPAMLSNGEYVHRASSVAKYGVPAMNAVNQGKAVIAYANGGPVGFQGFAGGGGVSVNPSTPNAASINSATLGAIQKLANSNASSLFSSVAASGGSGSGSNPGGGAAQWASLVLQVLGMYGLSASWLPNVLRQINTESGGNPNAINLWDSNAAAGDPSRGLMQTIMSTFLSYAGPFAGRGIYDPFANIYAAIGYTLSRYGSLSVLGNGHGYAMGTDNASKGWHMVGEQGPELVRFRGGESVTPNSKLGGNTYHLTINVPPTAQPAEVGREVVGAIKAFEKRSGAGWRN